MSVLWFIFVCGAGLCHANGVAPYRPSGDPYAVTTVVLMVFALTVFVECLVIDRLLGRPPEARRSLALWVLLINMVTNPAMQLFYYCFGYHPKAAASAIANVLPWAGASAPDTILVIAETAGPVAIEVAVVALEFVLFRKVFAHLYRCDRIEHPVGPGRTLWLVTAANVASYLFVLFAFFVHHSLF
jgi:hypothetical protein